ncbi:MAG: peptidoglycan-binding protein [Clostridia bacterium]|nr:peptidoglycan-binding protein [Clostridia bacterium]
MRLQQALIEKGYLAEGPADGAYGSMTVAAVKAAQKDMGLEADGVSTSDFQKKLYGEA